MRFFYIITVSLFTALGLRAETIPPAVRLAIISESSDVATAVDVLAAEFSKNEKLQLLERGQIEKIYREQALSAGGKDFLKLGQLLGADGLLVLEKDADAANPFLRVQLVAVQPGVLLSSERFGWPLKELPAWAAALARHLNPLWPKLGVRSADAIPISIVNLRSPIQSSAARETERQLTLLTIERLSREPQLFVLERRRMQWLAAEKTLKTLDDSAFWNGSCLLDGTLDNAGFSPDTITISARLVPPQGGAPVKIEVSGSRTNLGEVVNRLAEKILENLKLGGSRAPWNAADEAEQFFAEAQWALKWNLFPQAQAAAESAWALGKRSPDSARLLVNAYAGTLPDEGINGDKFPVQQVPDANAFAPLDRGLEFFSLSVPVLFAETNSPVSFNLGLRLLRPAFGQLESYYYAAEQRADHAAELLALREKIRRMFAVLDAHPPVVTNQWIGFWEDPRVIYPQMKWDEGGAAFEQPEDALKFYEDLLATGAIQGKLPRIIGWNWADRQRVPALLNRFINDACASTNVAARLGGLYFALRLAPDDEAGSTRRAEEELVSAMWENRDALFQSKDHAALVEQTRNALIKKLGGGSIYQVYDHEPFASFKHRLRKEFLTSALATNVSVLDELFPNTNVKMETPEQARELVPLMAALAQRLPTNRINYKLAPLRRNAGVAEAARPAPVAEKSATVLEATFIPWRVAQAGMFSDRVPRFAGMIFREGRLWVRVRYADKDRADFADNFSTAYLAVDPQRGVTEEISFPEKFGQPGGLFEVSSNALFVESGGKLFAHAFQKKSWTEISAPMEGASGLVWLDGRLFIGRGDGLLAVEPTTAKVALLASARRTPAANAIDPLWTPRTKIFPQADGRLGALVETALLVFDPAAERWDIRPLPLNGTNLYFNMAADYFSPMGVQRLLTGPFARRYLVGFWNEGAVETLLMEETGIRMNAPPSEKLLPPLRWDWPKKFPMEYSQIIVAEKNLWALAPRQLGMMSPNREPVTFSDARNATLFRFSPETRAPLAVAVHFPTDGLGTMPTMNGRPTDVLDPNNFGYMMIFQRFNERVGNMAFWLRVPGGLVFGGPNYCGHWFIADSQLKEMLAPLPAETPTPSHP